ncbi:hypothetical protein EJB05_00794, partial [Eragrostis curvula]
MPPLSVKSNLVCSCFRRSLVKLSAGPHRRASIRFFYPPAEPSRTSRFQFPSSLFLFHPPRILLQISPSFLDHIPPASRQFDVAREGSGRGREGEMEHCGGGGFGAIKAIALAGPGTDTPLSSPASPTSADRIRHPRPAGTCSIRGELVPGPIATTPVAPIHRDKISSKVLRSDESHSFGFARTKDKSAVTTQQCFRSGSVPIDLVVAALLRGEWRNDKKYSRLRSLV